jgi:pimeloyl-ACP methyl ester carboxylesterase
MLVVLGLIHVAANDVDIWTVLTNDPKGDTRADSGIDAAQLAFRYDVDDDMLWFRLAVYAKPNPDAFGMQLAIDSGTDGRRKAAWWGSTKDFRFDRLVTARVTHVGAAYRGTIGVADADGATSGDVTDISHDTLQLRVVDDGYILGVRRAEITSGTKMNVIAAVGTDREWTDEVPNARIAAIDLAAPRPARGLREIDVRRNNLEFPADYEPLGDDTPPSIVKRGRSAGRALILIPGVFSGSKAFDAFIARHQTDYRFFIVTPPGLNGTRARRMPPSTASYGARPWTRRLERDILDLIRHERLERPVIIAHGYPGSLAATALAANHSDSIGGVIEVAAMPVQPTPSPSDPTGATLMSPTERIRYQDELWAPQWFKYVTPETWESNNYPAPMFANDPVLAEDTRRRIEEAPLAVKVRYLVEANATDDATDLLRIRIPLLALRPGFTARALADPVNAPSFRRFVDAWNAFSTNAHLDLKTVADAAVLVFDDQPEAADRDVVAFLNRIGVAPERR